MKKNVLKLSKEELDMLSFSILFTMEKISETPNITSDLKSAIMKQLIELNELHSKICEAMR